MPTESMVLVIDMPKIGKLEAAWYFASPTCVCMTRRMLACHVPAPDHELLRAVMGDGRSDAEPQPITWMGPLRGKPPQRLDDVLGPAHAHCAGFAAVDRCHCIDKPRQRLIEGEVRHHGGDHRAQADRIIGARNRLHPVDGGRRKLEEQVVAGGGALLHLIDGRDQRGQIFVVCAAMAAQPWIGRLQDFKAPAVADSLRQSAMAVGVGIDQAGNDQASGRIEPSGVVVVQAEPGATRSTIVSPSITISRSSPRGEVADRTRPPVTTKVICESP